MRLLQNIYVRAFMVSVTVALLSLLLSKLNLFGSDTSADRTSDQIVQRIMAPFYGSASRGQNAISVVYVDDSATLDALIQRTPLRAWPPNFADYADMFDVMSRDYRPRAIFSDFLFVGEKADVSPEAESACALPEDGSNFSEKSQSAECAQWRLIETIARLTRYEKWRDKPACLADPVIKIACIQQAGGIPVILGRNGATSVPRWSAFQKKLAERAVFAPVEIDIEKYPLLVARAADPLSPAARPGGDKDLGVIGFDLSPAAALYAVWCLDDPNFCHDAYFSDVKKRAENLEPQTDPDFTRNWPDYYTAPVSIVWGSRPAARQSSLLESFPTEQPCALTDQEGKPDMNWLKAVELGTRTVYEALPLMRGASAARKPECLYSLHENYVALATWRINEADLKTLFDGRLVLLGSQYAGGTDWIDNPVHGRVPGVYYHAMALDNLIEGGLRYRHAAREGIDQSDWLETGLLIVLNMIGLVGIRSRHNLLEKRLEEKKTSHAMRMTVFYVAQLAFSGAVILLAVILGLAWHTEPINWLGVALTALTYGIFQMRKVLVEDMTALIAHNPVAAWVIRTSKAVFAWFDVQAELDHPTAPPKTRTRKTKTKKEPKA